MTATKHADASTLMSYAAGTLPAALAAAVAGHLALCPQCRREAAILDAIGASALRELARSPLARAMPDPLTGHIESGAGTPERTAGPEPRTQASAELPHPLAELIGSELDTLSWRFQAPGIHQNLFRFPNPKDGILRLIKAAPGAAIPEHGHHGMELTLVLRGAYRDHFGEFRRGDMADLDDSADHKPIADCDVGCICLVASEAEPVFRGLIPRLVQPFLRS